MDIIDSCSKEIDAKLESLNKYIEDHKDGDDKTGEFRQTQSIIQAVMADKDKNLDRILDQQTQIKMIIDRDGRVMQLKKTIVEDSKQVDMLRRDCALINMKALKDRQDLLEAQAAEIEKFQMQQLKSIAEDYRRHQLMLEQRKKEIEGLKKETENEDKNRAAYLADVEKNLERSLQSRQQMQQGTVDEILGVGKPGIFDEICNPNYCELTTVDELKPYGSASQPRSNSNRGGRGGARGRRKRGG